MGRIEMIGFVPGGLNFQIKRGLDQFFPLRSTFNEKCFFWQIGNYLGFDRRIGLRKNLSSAISRFSPSHRYLFKNVMVMVPSGVTFRFPLELFNIGNAEFFDLNQDGVIHGSPWARYKAQTELLFCVQNR
jgi:hypothetical protein